MSDRVNNLLYAAGPDLQNAIRIEILLTEPVDAAALAAALESAAVRYPYFAVRLVRDGAEYRMEPNPLPFPVSPAGKTVTLGTSESNGHLFAFAYDDCRLYFDTVHFITDGNGMVPFLKTILYYYLSALHPEARFDTAGIGLAGDPIPADEADDYPFPAVPVPEEPMVTRARPAEVFRMPGQPQGYESAGRWTSFRFRIRQRALMDFVSGVDGSPATFIASLLYQAVTAVHPDIRLPVVCGMQHQYRGALGQPRSHMCHVNIVPIVYPDRLRGKDIATLNTIARGCLILRADDGSDALTVNEHIRNEALIRGMTLSEKRAHMRGVILGGIGDNTFDVSYTGRVDWSGLDRYVRSVVPHFDLTLSGGLSAEIFSVGDAFCVNLMQRSAVPVYVDRFSAALEENGIPFTADAPVHFSLCGFRLPD